MARAGKRYSTTYKKKVDVERDAYLPRWSPKGTLYCGGCGAVYYRRRWTLTPPPEVRDWAEFRDGTSVTLCPACRKIRDRYACGELRLLGIRPREKREILLLLRNEEERARQKNPLERIMRLEQSGSDWRVETTTEKLAQRLGRALEKAFGGSVAYKWSHNNKFARVVWQSEAMKEVA
jgi:NMD protein affecting ribosome stability and mRNA decay